MEEREAGAAARVRDFGKGHHRMAFPYYLAINNRKKKTGLGFTLILPRALRLTSIPVNQIMAAVSPVISGQWEMVTGF